MNKCKYCGGEMVVEYFGVYGEIFKMKRNGESGKTRIRKISYGGNGEEPLVYCWNCRRTRGENE